MEIVNGVLKSITRYDIVNNKVTIPEGVTKIDDLVFNNYSDIYEVIIPESVEEIGRGAFKDCYDLKKVVLPPNLKEIKHLTFSNCKNLTEIILPENLEKIENAVFEHCTGLKEITLPVKLKEIGDCAFLSCTNLENVIIGEGVTTIGTDAFNKCRSLKKLTLPPKLEKIMPSLFFECTSLEEVNIPDGIQIIDKYAFGLCNLKEVNIPNSVQAIKAGAFTQCDLKKVKIPESVTSIGEYAFTANELEEIELPSELTSIADKAFPYAKTSQVIKTVWGDYTVPEVHRSKIKISTIYAYLYANHLLKEKYNSIVEMLGNRCICDLLENTQRENHFDIFKSLFYKLRRSFNVPYIVAIAIGNNKDFSLKVWNKIKNAFPYRYSETMQTALARMIELFNLFEKDAGQMKRVEDFLSLFSIENYTLNNSQYHSVLSRDEDRRRELEKYFEICKIEEYHPKSANYYENYKEEFAPYISGSNISLEQYKKIKKLSGSYGKRINDFIRENYELQEVEVYRVKREYLEDRDIKSYLFHTDVFGKVNYASIHRMFDGRKFQYNESFYKFLIENFPFIMENESYQSDIKKIIKKFPDIQKYYLKYSGVMIPSFAQVIDYIHNEPLLYEDGNHDFMVKARNAGVRDQETFNFYQEIYDKNKTRQRSSLVKRSNVYEIDGYTIKTELLRKDDPLSILVGESNYTNCCQIYGSAGQNCMAHATNSEDGGIFVTKLLKDGEWVLLTESWDWQNNNLYCHDNIEGTEYLKNGSESLKRAVAEAFRLDAISIIEKSKTEVEDYIEERKKRIKKSLLCDKEEELKKLEELEKSQVIKVVTSGGGYDDLGISNFFNQSFYANEERFIHGEKFTLENFQPLNYNSSAPYFDTSYSAYSDAKERQYIMAGSLEDLVLFRERKLEPIYRDQRRVSLEEGTSIHEETTEKIKRIEKEVYPEAMASHQNMGIEDYEEDHIYVGEDWYLIYEKKDNNSIYISDLARINPDLEDESGIQLQEMMNVIYDLVKKYDQVEADLKEDTSYLLYLLNKKLGYLEQIGEDISYSFDDKYSTKAISIEEQNEMLKNIKDIKNKKNPELIMHKVTFKKGKKLVDEEEAQKSR